ncbi:hypothetical protein [Streptomyces sp. GMY02]|uniref:hypothetical protein n=1 Tax=Streptomyces sp. GMY02 TaxID=1333528 RepID=UPI00349F591B
MAFRHVGKVEAAGFLPAKPVRIDGLQDHRVAQGGEGSLASALADLVDPVVGSIEELLDFVVRQRPSPRAALVLAGVSDRVPLMQIWMGC